ncbi:sulfurtransferase TusA family protein [Psychrobacter sp. Ps6]|uniref:sulfurtransferase TusA family protein n=1 Tax=Psychrobacter sp. Ps6 TaxID=2790960 RepID=UPI001EDE4AB6|nr:sulfurtransferase TusA family protein [Psychrobacter sp. Ps6]MCG3878192.1 sulfurtransferase TusA family protein [Psychrobacter sp. Ps6]
MSADSQLPIKRASHSIYLSANLSDPEQQEIHHLLDLLPVENGGSDVDTETKIDKKQPLLNIKRFVDGRGLACPMPLLKTKVALRDVAAGESLYVVATDPNSQADITAFCRQSQQTQTSDYLALIVNEVTNLSGNSTSLQRFATIYHFIITKTDSN